MWLITDMLSLSKKIINLVSIFTMIIPSGAVWDRQASSEPYYYTFNVPGVLEESASLKESASRYWWLDSGGKLIIENGIGATVSGALDSRDSWRLRYRASDNTDTDNGYHPQNLFRLITIGSWQNFQEEVYFKITANNLSSSPNRNESNGILLFGRYLDANNLYYLGLRVDGQAIIKKKFHGLYYELASEKIFRGNYDRINNPSLLFKGKWLGLRSEIKTLPDGSVRLALSADFDGWGNWMKIVEATDDVKRLPQPINAAGHAGIRTDFMDVQFRDFKITDI